MDDFDAKICALTSKGPNNSKMKIAWGGVFYIFLWNSPPPPPSNIRSLKHLT